VLLIIGTIQHSLTQVFAICRLLSLLSLQALSTATTGSARILHISPRLPPYQPTTTSVDQNAEVCPHIIPIHSRCFIPLHRHDASPQSLTYDMSSACIVKGTNSSNLLGWILTGISFLIGNANPQPRLLILSFITSL